MRTTRMKKEHEGMCKDIARQKRGNMGDRK